MNELKLRGEGVAWTDVDGEIVALDEGAAVYLAANEAGGMLWRALADRHDPGGALAELAGQRVRDRRRARARPTPTRSSPRCASAGCSRADAPAPDVHDARAGLWAVAGAALRARAAARRRDARRARAGAAAACAARGPRGARRARAGGTVVPGARAGAAALAAGPRGSRATSSSAPTAAPGTFTAHAWLDGEAMPGRAPLRRDDPADAVTALTPIELATGIVVRRHAAAAAPRGHVAAPALEAAVRPGAAGRALLRLLLRRARLVRRARGCRRRSRAARACPRPFPITLRAARRPALARVRVAGAGRRPPRPRRLGAHRDRRRARLHRPARPARSCAPRPAVAVQRPLPLADAGAGRGRHAADGRRRRRAVGRRRAPPRRRAPATRAAARPRSRCGAPCSRAASRSTSRGCARRACATAARAAAAESAAVPWTAAGGWRSRAACATRRRHRRTGRCWPPTRARRSPIRCSTSSCGPRSRRRAAAGFAGRDDAALAGVAGAPAARRSSSHGAPRRASTACSSASHARAFAQRLGRQRGPGRASSTPRRCARTGWAATPDPHA